MKRTHIILSGLLVLALVAGLASLFANDFNLTNAQGDDFTYAGETDAPDFPGDLDWLNVSEPLTMDELEGKIVLLDFWTYGCINCMHTIPDFQRLEAEFGDDLVVIGVHSAKFATEGETDNIREVVQRYGVTHPVVNDNDFAIWRTYGVRAWPTQVLIDPNGKVVGGRSGEGVYELFQPILDTMVAEYAAAGLIDSTRLAKLAPEVTEREQVMLNYPGKVFADVEGNRLIVSDSSNHRIVVSSLDTFDNIQVIGTGQPGFVDGAADVAQFNMPQGLALSGDTLFVADTANHAIRAVDLTTGEVTTAAGTGEQANTYPPVGGTAPDVALSSPWDLVFYDGALYIAMAGPHQLWKLDLATNDIGPYAGNAREDIIDGPLADAQLAQPSGIATNGEVLYFADSEVSAIRSADLDPNGDVETIVGTGLFEFGDVDGQGDEVRLQHALGVTVSPDGLLYVADTYNSKIKLIDPVERTSVTFAGTGDETLVDGEVTEAAFFEPGGLHYADGKIYVADTNNHAIRIIDLDTNTVSTVEYADPMVLVVERSVPADDDVASNESGLDDDAVTFTDANENVITFPMTTVQAGEGDIVFDIQIPEGYKLNDAAPFTVFNPEDEHVTVDEDFLVYQEVLPELPVRIPATFSTGQTEFSTDVTIYWCEGVNYTLCFVENVTFTVPVLVADTASETDLTLTHVLVPPELN
ncbi:MAG: redoxin domain-containing protein [Chloroflexi bacterium]|nr:redoxin domain-containing protein [Chloroflexota bacterium]